MFCSIPARAALLVVLTALWGCRHDFPAGTQDSKPSSEGGGVGWPDARADVPGGGGADTAVADWPKLERSPTFLDKPKTPDKPLPPDTKPHQCSQTTPCPSSPPCGTGVCENGLCKMVPAGTGTTCRPSAGNCDVAEKCNGLSTTCPADVWSSGTVCRPATGPCDAAESCNGSSPHCPTDVFASGTVCRPVNGACDVAESCNGSSPSCPADGFASGTVCRPASGACDVAESCNGSSAACPADGFASGTVCRPAGGTCDVAESCSGSSAACPGDVFAPSTTVCRPSTGACDPAESCTAGSPSCPGDVTWPTKSATFTTVWGHDGFVGQTTMGYQRVEATCFDENGTSVLNRGFVSFETASLPDNAAILSADLTACYEGGPGGDTAQLYSTSFSLNLSMSAFNAPVTYLKDLPNTTGTHTVAVQTSSVKTSGPTQYSMRYPTTECLGGWYGKRWGSSTCPALSHCPANSPWSLSVTYCAP